MGHDLWKAVDAYIDTQLVTADAALDAALASNAAANLPAIDVSPAQGKMLHILARIAGAKSILEIGTLGGYSTIWLARALPEGGRIISLEVDPRHAEVARANIARAGLEHAAEVRTGKALDTLPALKAEGLGPFDMIFIDADKPSNPHYFQWALRLSRPGTMIIVDNVIRQGGIIDAANTEARIAGTRQLFEMLAAEPRVTATAIQTVGSKGHDGFILAVVNEPAA